MTRTTLLAALAALALLALPLAASQSGPPPGYTDPVAYAQDYAKQQADEAAADPTWYATSHATPDAVANETRHAAWLACWTAHSQGLPLDAACSQFFVAPGVVDAPADAEAEITETINGTGADALLAETTDALADTLDDPTTAVEQVKRIVNAVREFLATVVGGVKDAAEGLVDGIVAFAKVVVHAVSDLVGAGQTVSLAALQAVRDGLMAVLGVVVGLPVLGALAGLEGLAAAATGAADGLAAAGTGLVSALEAIGHGLAAAASAFASAAGTGLDGLASGAKAFAGAIVDAGAAAVDAVGDAAGAVVETVSDAAEAVTDTVAGWFGSDAGSGAASEDLLDDGGLETGTEADGLVDRILGLL